MCKNYNWASRTFYPIKKIAYVSQYSFSEKKKKLISHLRMQDTRIWSTRKSLARFIFYLKNAPHST